MHLFYYKITWNCDLIVSTVLHQLQQIRAGHNPWGNYSVKTHFLSEIKLLHS